MTTLNSAVARTRQALVALVAVVVFATPALAGPPLICHPFLTDGGKLIAWGSGNGWNSPDRSYDIKNLIADTTAVVTADSPVLTRMENLRRASIYAMKDPQVANALLKVFMDRALHTTTNGTAWFDAGYLIETYKQAVVIRELRNPSQPGWAEVDETIKVDGYNWVKKAMAMTTSPSAEMEFAASLMTQGSLAQAHRAKAIAAAPKNSVIARNLAALAF